jgi:hypothetical protein
MRSAGSRLAAVFFPMLLLPFVQAAQLAQTAATPLPEQLRAEHQRVLDDLNVKDTNGKPMELDDPRVPGLARHGWELAGAWAATYLETHRAPSKHNLERIFEGFAPAPRGTKSQYGNFLEYSDYSLQGSAVQIGPSVYVVEASYGVDFSTSTFMVVARNRAGHFEALWNIKDLAEKHYPSGDEIGRWMHLVRRAYYNGPLVVSRVLPVPPAANGHARFLVDAVQAANGGTHLAQLSIWEWDGTEARPLLVEVYQYAADFGGFRFDGNTVRISTKEEFKTLFSCGMCPEPRGIWTVRIEPDGVENLGHRFAQPELQWADELLSKIDKGEDASNLADAKVLDALKARIRDEQATATDQVQPSDETAFSWGMLGRCRVLRRGQRGAFVLGTDEGNLHFSYVRRNGRPHFTNVEIE